MGLFSLDFERFYQHIRETGGQLKGIFCIQYPVYCIHATISDITPDALDNIDRVICDFYSRKPDFTTFQIGSLIGTSKMFVELRTQVLLRDGLLEKSDGGYQLTIEGRAVFHDKVRERQHNRSYDFYLDGITLQPLPKVFYTFYRSKLISEYDVRFFTTSTGETRTSKPFGPDIVHTPPDKSALIEKIFGVLAEEREQYGIPSGLVTIDDTSFTKQTFQLLIAVSSFETGLVKEVIDGFAAHSLSEGISYYETVKKHIKVFESTLKEKIQNLEFKITIPRLREDSQRQPKPIITSNWGELDCYRDSRNRCFSFSSEDLLKVIEEIFEIKNVAPESVVNEETTIEISLNKQMLMNSSDRHRLVESLIRERDYYYVANAEKNVFLIYLYYKTEDDFVRKVIQFKSLLKKEKRTAILNYKWFTKLHPEFAGDYRELLAAAGELEILEKVDIENYMAN
ncbi:hypothetical protein [Taibaiella chishuiensis]|uniref:Uncharacterized protein n=1 Tax=Taibaiella chishuiensis TaxID=1434707 RepID=A0A2P8D4T2_9BACT|nr:hypothetical protein [Taibaiella chishuiensis]PSK92224.1 hypothetical protein B0I18_104323 [Taibaiella chishuiensis]